MSEKNEKKLTKVYIPDVIVEKIKKRIEGSSFETISEYISHVLNDVLSKEEDIHDAYSEEDEKIVKERLKALGYLD
jgi:Arc/MetJ-type ribon-helix-helix transcriptional regulator